MKNRQNLIDSLSNNLEEVNTPFSIDLIASLWLIASVTYIIIITQLFGPIRQNALEQLVTQPQFAIEIIAGALAITLMTFVAFRAAVPGALTRKLSLIGIGAILLWIAGYVVGLFSPVLEPSMFGKREHCFIETVAFSIAPMLGAFFLTRRYYPLKPFYTALSFSLVAGMMPALYMQIACMYSPEHTLRFHILPGLEMACVGILLGFGAKRIKQDI